MLLVGLNLVLFWVVCPPKSRPNISACSAGPAVVGRQDFCAKKRVRFLSSLLPYWTIVSELLKWYWFRTWHFQLYHKTMVEEITTFSLDDNFFFEKWKNILRGEFYAHWHTSTHFLLGWPSSKNALMFQFIFAQRPWRYFNWFAKVEVVVVFFPIFFPLKCQSLLEK